MFREFSNIFIKLESVVCKLFGVRSRDVGLAIMKSRVRFSGGCVRERIERA